MEWKIGEIFEHNGEWYQCVEGICAYCSIKDEACEQRIINDVCKLNLIFKKLEKVGEPFSCNYYGDSRLVMMQEYQLFDSNVIYYYHTPPMYITDYKHKRIAIEIKQNKEDMGDLDKIKVRDYTKVEELNVMEEKKLNLKPFDIQKAREGKPVCTRDGRKVRIVCFDRKRTYPIIALIEEGEDERVCSYMPNGRRYEREEGWKDDLMMLPEKKEGWVNVYKDSVYDTKDEALIGRSESRGYIDTIKISWEE